MLFLSRLVAKLKNEEAVIGGIGNSNFDLWGAGRRPQNFYMLGSMGLAAPIALGVALAQPKRRVIALEGDGSILMQLGALATIANLNPKNLVIVVWDNGMYQITGSQPAATAGLADLVEIARGAGIAQSAWATGEEDFERLIEQAIGPTQGTEYFTVNSIAYRMALVATGAFDAAVALSPTCDWDIVAAHALILAAGGKVSGRNGEPLVYNRPSVRHHGMIAAGPKLHGELTKRFRGGLLG